MGFALEISIPLAAEVTIADALAPAFGGSFFQPVAMGAIERNTPGNDWFLAGYALEHFLGVVLAVKIRPPASISLFSSLDAELNTYQQQCADAVKGAALWNRPRSPFERVDAQVGVTVLEPKHLPDDALIALTRWTDRFRRASISVYGSIPLALQRPAESTWSRAFSEAGPTEDSQSTSLAPFLNLNSYATPSVGRLLIIRTQDLVWLREAQALGGRVTPEDADKNLQELASFARTLAQGKRSKTRAIELSMDGRFYTREEARIRAAFRDLL
jgi:hypothetical protein